MRPLMDSLYRRIKKWFDDLTFLYKFFFCYLLMMAVPFLLFITVSTRITLKNEEARAIEASNANLAQMQDLFNYRFKFLFNSTVFLSKNPDIINILQKKSSFYSNNTGDWFSDYLTVNKQIQELEANPDLTGSSVQFFMYDSLAGLYQSNSTYQLMSKAQSQPWYRQLVGHPNIFAWDCSSGQPCVSFAAWISTQESLNNHIGIVKANIPMDTINQNLLKALPSPTCSVFLADRAGNIITDVGDAANVTPPYLKRLITQKGPDESQRTAFRTETSQGAALVNMGAIDTSDWVIVLVEPFRYIDSQNSGARQQLLLLLLILPITIPFSYLISASLTKRLRSLSRHMKQLENGNFDIGIIPGSEDEIGQVIRTYNYMLTKISNLLDEKYTLGIQVKDLELQALQSQIKPHFLYNTLDLINLKSYACKPQEVSRLVLALSKFYKISLSSGEQIISVREEIEQLTAYFEIQKMRYPGQLALRLEIPQMLYSFKVPKIIFQPIVENSIKHGILAKDDASGTVSVTGEQRGGDIVFRFADDGIGIPPEKLETLLEDRENTGRRGCGIWNVHERLRLYYGEGYGLSYQSAVGRGTTVTMRIQAKV